jgi:tetratricopeptide (TPR) repeat protein
MVKMREVDPLSPAAAYSTATALQYAGRYDEAVSESERAVALDPANPNVHVVYGRALAAVGRFDDAKREFTRAVGSTMGADYLRAEIASADAGTGRRNEALAVAEALTRQFEAAPDRAEPELLGYLYARLGDNDHAFVYLTRALEKSPDRMLYLKVDPRVESLRNDRRFALLLAKLGLQP